MGSLSDSFPPCFPVLLTLDVKTHTVVFCGRHVKIDRKWGGGGKLLCQTGFNYSYVNILHRHVIYIL